MTPTHIVVTFKSQHSELLYRAGDGMCIGQRKNAVIVFGESPNKKDSRVFIDETAASLYLRETVTSGDMKEDRPVVIQERDGENTIVLPEGIMEIPGGLRNFN